MRTFLLIALVVVFSLPRNVSADSCASQFSDCLAHESLYPSNYGTTACIDQRAACLRIGKAGLPPIVVPPVIAFDPFAVAIARDVDSLNQQSLNQEQRRERRGLRDYQREERQELVDLMKEQRANARADMSWREFDALLDAQKAAYENYKGAQEEQRKELREQQKNLRTRFGQ